MADEKRRRRLQTLSRIPAFARLDHRLLLDEDGTNPMLAALPRKQRSRLKAESRAISKGYVKIMMSIRDSGAGYENDQLLRGLSIEYTNRYAASGTHTQPLSFNYFEPFCEIGFVNGSLAPYIAPSEELCHIFSIDDYFDYITSSSAHFEISEIKEMPDGVVFHYTPSGSIADFTFMSPAEREFVLAGFSMVRRGNSLHWFAVGGELHSEEEWEFLVANPESLETEYVYPPKAKFMQHVREQNGDSSGPPLSLNGTARALKTIISGELNIDNGRHVSRIYMKEFENSFSAVCDDPELFDHVLDELERTRRLSEFEERVADASALWNLAEALFQLHSYFDFRIPLKKMASSNLKRPAPTPRGGRAVRETIRYVPTLEYEPDGAAPIRKVRSRHYQVEREGYWRRIKDNEYGYDDVGNSVRGKTWIRKKLDWRDISEKPRTIYVKSTVASARIDKESYLSAAARELKGSGSEEDAGEEVGVLYVLRCAAMQDEVYKVGWTSGTATRRARELSSTSGVPHAFVVVGSWRHDDPEGLEEAVHAMLAPYRLNNRREFFQIPYSIIQETVEAEIRRSRP